MVNIFWTAQVKNLSGFCRVSEEGRTLDAPAHDVVLASRVVVPDGQLQVTRLIVEHVQVELLKPAWGQSLRLVLQSQRPSGK